MKNQIFQLGPIFWENIVYIIKDPHSPNVIILDPPPCFEEIDKWIQQNGWNLTGILNTHYHLDHAGGINPLKQKYTCPVWGPVKDRKRTPTIDHHLHCGDSFSIFGFQVSIKELLGHTETLIAYWFEQSEVLFCSDILFSLGCGKFFEGTPSQMLTSLDWISNLPDTTLLYSSHEATLNNGKFALTVEPENLNLIKHIEAAENLRAQNHFTLPTTLGKEKLSNPFLRTDSIEICKSLKLPPGSNRVKVLEKLRMLKDNF